MHGSLLPKNPWLADKLIGWALARWALARRNGATDLTPLEDREEDDAREAAIALARRRQPTSEVLVPRTIGRRARTSYRRRSPW